MRKGMTIEALKDFMLEQGPSQNNNLMEWDKIWANNKKVIDPIAPRYCCVGKDSACKMFIKNGPSPVEARSTPLHPKNEAVGTKATIYGTELWIERDDALEIAQGEKITLMKWGNATVTKKVVDGQNIQLWATVDEADKDYKGTKKITWLCADPTTTVDIKLIEYAHLIDKPKIEEADDIEKLVNKDSKHESQAIAEGSVRTLQKGDILQFERRGFYIIDKIGLVNQQLTCIFIPDGKAKAMSSITHTIDAAEMQKGKGNTAAKPDKKKNDKALAAGEGEEVKLSKKDLAKMAKKASKADMKAGVPQEAKPKGKPAGAPQGKGAKKEAVPLTLAPPSGAQGAHVDELEKKLFGQQYLGGAQPSQSDYMALLSLND